MTSKHDAADPPAKRTRRATAAERVPPPGACTCHQVRSLARHITALYDESLAPVGLTVTQYSALATLARSDAPLSMVELGKRLQMDRSTTTRLLAPLQRAALVSEARGAGADARAHRLQLTARGTALLASAVPAWQSAEARIAGLLGAELHHGLRQALREAGAALQR